MQLLQERISSWLFLPFGFEGTSCCCVSRHMSSVSSVIAQSHVSGHPPRRKTRQRASHGEHQTKSQQRARTLGGMQPALHVHTQGLMSELGVAYNGNFLRRRHQLHGRRELRKLQDPPQKHTGGHEEARYARCKRCGLTSRDPDPTGQKAVVRWAKYWEKNGQPHGAYCWYCYQLGKQLWRHHSSDAIDRFLEDPQQKRHTYPPCLHLTLVQLPAARPGTQHALATSCKLLPSGPSPASSRSTSPSTAPARSTVRRRCRFSFPLQDLNGGHLPQTSMAAAHPAAAAVPPAATTLVPPQVAPAAAAGRQAPAAVPLQVPAPIRAAAHTASAHCP